MLTSGQQKAEDEGWLAATEGAFAFWDNDDDAVWDRVALKRPTADETSSSSDSPLFQP